MLIYIDLDGVLADFESAMVEILKKLELIIN